MTRRTSLRGADLEPALRALREEFAVPARFSPQVLAEADRVGSSWSRAGRVDATGLPLVTLDPQGSRDLDQAFALEPVGAGFRFHYAIADVCALVSPDGELAAEAKRRGETLYLPDGRAPLYPPSMYGEPLSAAGPSWTTHRSKRPAESSSPRWPGSASCAFAVNAIAAACLSTRPSRSYRSRPTAGAWTTAHRRWSRTGTPSCRC